MLGSDHRTRLRRAALPIAGALLAPLIITAPAFAAPPAPVGTAMAMSAPAAVSPVRAGAVEVTATAGRSGKTLRTIYVDVSVSTSDPAAAKRARIYVQKRTGGKWKTVKRATLTNPLGPPKRIRWTSAKAATVRVRIPALKQTTPRLKVPAAPKSTASRYYVRNGDAAGRLVLRVFRSGQSYGTVMSGMEYSCVAGTLKGGKLRLRSFDFGGWSVSCAARGSWRTLKLKDDRKAVGKPRTKLTGANAKRFGWCDDPAYAQAHS